MKKLLHIIATPREDESRTLRVTGAFLEGFGKSHPDWVVEELNLYTEELPQLTVKRVDGKYMLLAGRDLFGELKEAWEAIIAQIERFTSADGYLVSTPMWNFSIPYRLKQYIDVIVQPKYLFRYTATGVEGLVKGRRMVVAASRGGDYSTPETRGGDFQEPYLRFIFGFVGITDISFVVAQPTDMGQEPQEAAIRRAQAAAREAGESF